MRLRTLPSCPKRRRKQRELRRDGQERHRGLKTKAGSRQQGGQAKVVAFGCPSGLPVFSLGGGAFGQRPAAQVGPHDRRRLVGGLVQRDVDSGRYDFVDAIQEIVPQAHLGARQQVVEMLHDARAREWPT
jgi:hypothetical protein